MPNYKEMYYQLFYAQVKAKEILKQAEKETEEMFIDSVEPLKLAGFETTEKIIKEKKESH